MFQNRRWDNDFLTLAALLAAGELGTVSRFESRFERWRPQPKGGWRESGDPAEIGGLLYDLGSHLVDQALTLFGPAATVYAESDVRRPGAHVDDDTFIAIGHTGGVRSHLWMSATTARLGPRFRVLGSSAGYVVHGLDPQEAALRDGLRPGPGWGTVPESARGTIGAGDDTRPVPTLPGDYPAYYAAVATALRDGTPPPVTRPRRPTRWTCWRRPGCRPGRAVRCGSPGSGGRVRPRPPTARNSTEPGGTAQNSQSPPNQRELAPRRVGPAGRPQAPGPAQPCT